MYILLYGGALPGGVGASFRWTCILLYVTRVKKKPQGTSVIPNKTIRCRQKLF